MVADLVKSAKKNKESVEELLEMAGENGDLVRLSDEMYMHSEIFNETKTQLAEEISKANGLTMSEIRQLLDISRKYAIPFCEYLDKIGFTVRDGDKRLLGSTQPVA